MKVSERTSQRMDDLINRAALGIGKCNPDVFDDKGYAKGWNAVIDLINAAPTIDAVSVVRCRECRHGLYNEYYGNVVCSAHLWTKGPRYFCGDRERREDGKA